jgi:hypothetical protein
VDTLNSGNLPSIDAPITNFLSAHQFDRRVRIDFEPDWEDDPRTILFRARVEGMVKYIFRPRQLIDMLTNGGDSALAVRIISCNCRTPVFEIPVPLSEKWKALEMSQLIGVVVEPDEILKPLIPRSENSLCIYTAGDVASQALCLAIFGANVVFAKDCLKCAYQYGRERTHELPNEPDWVLICGCYGETEREL